MVFHNEMSIMQNRKGADMYFYMRFKSTEYLMLKEKQIQFKMFNRLCTHIISSFFSTLKSFQFDFSGPLNLIQMYLLIFWRLFLEHNSESLNWTEKNSMPVQNFQRPRIWTSLNYFISGTIQLSFCSIYEWKQFLSRET